MNMDDADMNTALMVDGNAVAGQLMDVFGRDMTIAVARCAGCTREAEMGALMAFTRGPGVVLRCPACEAAIAARRSYACLANRNQRGPGGSTPPGPVSMLRQPLLLSPLVMAKFAVMLPTLELVGTGLDFRACLPSV